MPTYEYCCKDCGEDLEVVQSFTDEALTECPNCGGDLRKVFGNIGVTFKGSGFYRNDSRPPSKKTAAKKDSDSSEKVEKAGTAEKSESTSSGNGSSSGDSSSGSKAEPKKAEPKSEAKSA